ncbi:MAG: TolB family protein [Chloroflexota bacterium]
MKTNFSHSPWLILALLLTACAPLAPAPAITPSATSVPSSTPTLPPTETPTPTPAPQQPPACTFPLEQTMMEESKPEEYTFSEPRVVLSAPNSTFSISEWLPDSQRILIKRTVVEQARKKYDSMELFNPTKIKTQTYAKLKPRSYDLPVWVSGLEGVLYQELIAEPASYDTEGNYIPPSSDIAHMLLVLSQDGSNNATTIDDSQYNHWRNTRDIHPTWVFSSLAVKPDGNEIVYLKASSEIYQFYRRKVSQGQFSAEQLLPIGADMLKNYNVIQYEMAWRPYTEQIFFAGHDGTGNIQSFLFDMSTGKSCILDFRGSSLGSRHQPLYARWSPSGRYLAIVRGNGGFPVDSIDLAVLDIATGDLFTLALPPITNGVHFVWDVAWAPDNYHIAVIGKITGFFHCGPNCIEDTYGLYLVDFISGKVDLVFPSFQFSGGDVGHNLAWSPDGTKILANCSVENAGRLCLISVQRTPQP